MKKVAISVGDVNGVGLQIALLQHSTIKKICDPIYCVHQELLLKACELLGIDLPLDMELVHPDSLMPTIKPSVINPQSGAYSYASFIKACELADKKEVSSICTLPIHKQAWHLAGVKEIGHTEALAKRYDKNAIMMLGCEEMFVALFSDHISLKEVSSKIKLEALKKFLKDLYRCVQMPKALVLGLNPHCGDGGILGREDEVIAKAIEEINAELNQEIFIGPLPADSAFSPLNREKYKFFVSMYHDVGLAVLKALYFYESINITLNIPILRTSVDHGVAYDIAYKTKPNPTSYINAMTIATKWKSNE